MRLIDADKLRKEIHMSYSDDLGIREVIDEQHTAYDVDKVIEEIEKIISSYELCVETSLKEIEKNGEDKMSFEICSLHNNRGYLSGLRKALEIVKSGGVADD